MLCELYNVLRNNGSSPEKKIQFIRVIPELFLQIVPFGMTMLGGRKNRYYRRSLARDCGISIEAPQRLNRGTLCGIFTKSSTETRPLNFPWNLRRDKTVELSVEFSRKAPQRLNCGTFYGTSTKTKPWNFLLNFHGKFHRD